MNRACALASALPSHLPVELSLLTLGSQGHWEEDMCLALNHHKQSPSTMGL